MSGNNKETLIGPVSQLLPVLVLVYMYTYKTILRMIGRFEGREGVDF
jgi:hypothetical protein